MPITLTTYPDEDLAIFTCTGVFHFNEWLAVGRDDLRSPALFQINDIRRIDFTVVKPDVLKEIVLHAKRQIAPHHVGRGKTAFIIQEDFQGYDLFNIFMRWVNALELNRDFALLFSTAKALEWFGLDPAVAPDNARG